MYFLSLLAVFILTTFGFTLLRAFVAKRSVSVFDGINITIATCVTFLAHYYQ